MTDKTASDRLIVRVAVKAPLAGLYDYLAPRPPCPTLRPGMRVKVPFGRSQQVAMVIETGVASLLAPGRLRRIETVLDTEPVLDAGMLGLLNWAATYYRHPPGEVVAAALPGLLRRGAPATTTETVWVLTASGAAIDISTLKRAPRQAAALSLLSAHVSGLNRDSIEQAMGAGWRSCLATLEKKAWVDRREVPIAGRPDAGCAESPDFELTDDQRTAVATVAAALGQYGGFLLNGITGSGKTEVYLRLITQVSRTGAQTLVLVPEIGLTPQLVERFRRRLDVPLVVMHSGLTETQRLAAWQAAQRGRAGVVVGTRSAVFAPLRTPGLIIVDEEHDASYKQQEGFRYSARDVAVMRARRHNIPVLLGSATPSLESLHNAREGRYTRIDLGSRPGSATLPPMRLVDMRRSGADGALSNTLVTAIHRHLERDGQVLLFLNRRGYAPAWYCVDCGWIAPCKRCDARMTFHQAVNRLRCHHCGAERHPESVCPACDSVLQPVGQGTERIEQTIARLFPDIPLARIDRDSTRRRGSLENLIGEIRRGEHRILIGTQMLTKGHHFPAVTLVGILDADQGLFGIDPRSNERLAQMIVQVAGRAGRAEQPGEVLIQTHCPEHPLLNKLIDEGYDRFADAALEERRASGWPPFSALTLLRAEAGDDVKPMRFLTAARELAGNQKDVLILGPAPAQMARRAGRYRAHLLLQADRGALQRFLSVWAGQLDTLSSARQVRWSLDVDPLDLY